ncbi:MAG: cytochrome c biogenesis protein CcsA [Chthonomonadales bacterium]
MITVLLSGGALLLYTAAAVLYGADFSLRVRGYGTIARVLFLAGLGVHTAAIGAECLATRHGPFASSFGTLSVLAWASAVVYVPLEAAAHTATLGVLAAPVTSLLLFAALIHARAEHYTSPLVRTRIINFHVLMVLVSFGLFALAACCAVFYVWQYGALKHPNGRALFRRLPPLEVVDAIAYHLVAFAVPLLTLGLLLGIVRAALGGLHGNWLLDPHTLVSMVVWAIYTCYLVARGVAGWRGIRVNSLLILGMIAAAAIFFVPTSTHRFT